MSLLLLPSVRSKQECGVQRAGGSKVKCRGGAGWGYGMMLIMLLLQCVVGSSSGTSGGDNCVTWCQQAHADSGGSGEEGGRCGGASWQQLTRVDKWREGAVTGGRSLQDDRGGECWSGGSWQQIRGAVAGGSWQKAPTGGSGSSSASNGGSN